MAKSIRKPERLSKRQLLEKIDEILPMFQAESERGSALLAGAFLDDVLVGRLKEFFVPDEGAYKDITGVDRPLGTASSRIAMGYLLGLYGPKTRDTLRKIAEIRNAFAHYHQFAHFSDPEISQACLGLLPGYVEAIMDDPKHPTCTDPRRRFQACVGWLIVDFLNDLAPRRQPQIGFDYYHDDEPDTKTQIMQDDI